MHNISLMILIIAHFNFFFFKDGFTLCVTFEPCSDSRKNEPCNMTCLVPNVTEDININCNGSSRSSCTFLGCTSNTHEVGTTAVYLEISSLSYSTDNCEWSCTYGANSSSSSPFTVVSKYQLHLSTEYIQVMAS